VVVVSQWRGDIVGTGSGFSFNPILFGELLPKISELCSGSDIYYPKSSLGVLLFRYLVQVGFSQV
jgi:hypothetical protein